MDSGLQDKCVLITGASGGIGLATAQAFAAEGARLVLHCHTHPEPLQKLQRDIGVPARIVAADLRDERQVEHLFDEALQIAPRVDVVVANAGWWAGEFVPLHEMTLAQWHETLNADLTSVFLTSRAFLRHLAAVPREAAALVLVGSTAAIFGEAGNADYAAAKAGLAYGLNLSLKNEIVRLAPRGRVNCVCPGWTRTAMADGHLAATATMRQVQATIPLNKVATPEDVASAIVFLASDRLAGHLSGVVLPVSGGMEGRLLNPPRRAP